MKARALVLLNLALGGAIGPSACNMRTDEILGAEAPGANVFITPDASSPEAEAGLVEYCASNQCPAGRATCPSSRFPCDVNLQTDPLNCGGCGLACPTSARGGTLTCIEGKCVLACDVSLNTADCDGFVDNGCETSLTTDDNCNACGNKCDPSKPCVDRSIYDFGCGCYPDQTFCPGTPDWPGRRCIDANNDDSNCGACGNICKTSPAPYTNTYHGCVDKKCGEIKCVPRTADCDGNLLSNGCETSLTTDDNCGGCGIACGAGQHCRLNQYFAPQCMCAEGQTFCSGGDFMGIPVGKCHDLRSDREACGACGKLCSATIAHGTTACVYGVCEGRCYQGWADCNGSINDGCETITDSDPRNCGACGNACDAIAGQACVGGRCVVEPCSDGDAGGRTR